MYSLKARFELYQFYTCNLAVTFPLTCFTVEHKLKSEAVYNSQFYIKLSFIYSIHSFAYLL